MSKPVKVLLVEDSENDAEMAVRLLRRGGFEVQFERVDTAQGVESALSRQVWDAVIADYRMPQFTGLDALKILRASGSDIPFILVSGNVGEEIAVEAMKAGANDFVIKTNLSRLPPVLERELRESANRSEYQRAQDRLRASEGRYRRLFEAARDGILLLNADTGQIEDVNPYLVEMLGYSHAEFLGKKLWEVGMFADIPESKAMFRALQTNGYVRYKDLPLKTKAGAAVPVEFVSNSYNCEGVTVIQCNIRDITERKRADEQIRRLNRVYAVLSGINAAIVRIRDRQQLFQESCRIAVEAGRFVIAWIGVVNREASIVKLVASAGDVRGLLENTPGGDSLAARAIRAKVPVISNDVKNDPQWLMHKELEERGINSVAIIPLIVNGEAVGIFGLHAADVGFFDAEEMRLLTELAGDVSFALDHIEKAERLDYISYYDPLTGLPNRTLFHERLKLQLDEAARKDEKVALQILDLERFKTINDTLGRQAGDALLGQVAQRMKQGTHARSWFARIGADHFAIVMPDVATEEGLARRTETRLAEIFGSPFSVAGTALRISAQIGIALFPSDGTDADTLFRNAEAALKNAKATRERYLFYTREMTERIAEKLSLENKLRQAFEKQEFVLHYQPKVDLENRQIVGVEALIRWQSPELGLVPPGRFIPLLEETGLILQVGSWALRRAALDHRAWVEQKLKAPRVAVNVSQIQLRQRDFVRVVEDALIEGVAPTGIDLEITESMVMQDVQANIEKLDAVRKLGVRIAIDDFGTGYSSLAYLAKLPVETLKIDRSFISSMLDDAHTATLVQTVISMAHSLRLKVVAEGVETEVQARTLRLLGCDEMQGFVFSKALPLEQMTALLRTAPS